LIKPLPSFLVFPLSCPASLLPPPRIFLSPFSLRPSAFACLFYFWIFGLLVAFSFLPSLFSSSFSLMRPHCHLAWGGAVRLFPCSSLTSCQARSRDREYFFLTHKQLTGLPGFLIAAVVFRQVRSCFSFCPPPPPVIESFLSRSAALRSVYSATLSPFVFMCHSPPLSIFGWSAYRDLGSCLLFDDLFVTFVPRARLFLFCAPSAPPFLTPTNVWHSFRNPLFFVAPLILLPISILGFLCDFSLIENPPSPPFISSGDNP